MDFETITDPEEVAAYLASVRHFYGDAGVEAIGPDHVLVKTGTGIAALAFLIEDEDSFSQGKKG